MKKSKRSRFAKEERLVVTHSYHGLIENMVVTVSNNLKDSKNQIEVALDDKILCFPVKYLNSIDPKRFSKKFNVKDDAGVIRSYHRFVKNSIVTVMCNYRDSGNRIIVEDERGIIGPIPEMFLKHVG